MRALFLAGFAAFGLMAAGAPLTELPATVSPDFEATTPPAGIDEAYIVRPHRTIAADGSLFYRVSEEGSVERFMLVGQKPKTGFERLAQLVRIHS